MEINLMDMNKLMELYKDPRHGILSEVLRVLDSQRIWAGMEYTYHPLSPRVYRPLRDKVSIELDKIAKEYGL
jgi:hypothetical protein